MLPASVYHIHPAAQLLFFRNIHTDIGINPVTHSVQLHHPYPGLFLQIRCAVSLKNHRFPKQFQTAGRHLQYFSLFSELRLFRLSA